MLFLVSEAWMESDYAKIEQDCARIKDWNTVNTIYVIIKEGFRERHCAFVNRIDIVRMCSDYKDNETFWTELEEKIKEKTPAEQSAPWGDVAHGNAWSYYYGYLNIIFQSDGFENGIEKWQKDHPECGRLVQKLLVICPKISKPVKLDDFKSIKKFKKTQEREEQIKISRDRAGNYRSYDISVYHITDSQRREVFVPMTVNWTLVHMSKIPETFPGVTEKEVKSQGDDFLNELRQIVSLKGHSQKVELVEVEEDAKEDDMYLADLIVSRCQ